MDLYSKLYPQLKFTRKENGELNSLKQAMANNIREATPPKSPPKIVEQVPVYEPPIPVVEVIPEPVIIQEPPKEPTPVKRELTPKQERVIIKRPNRLPPPEKVIPFREDNRPKKGEHGIQRKYSEEQRRQMYLDRLSRKSIIGAQKEVEEVEAVMETIGNTIEDLEKEEKIIKKKMKLISYAKFFAQGSSKSDDINICPEQKP